MNLKYTPDQGFESNAFRVSISVAVAQQFPSR